MGAPSLDRQTGLSAIACQQQQQKPTGRAARQNWDLVKSYRSSNVKNTTKV